MGATKPKLMILGAGLHQVMPIRRAASMGLHVITVDYCPDNMGHRFSHEYVNASTTDQDAVLAAARALEIDGIVTFASDVATPTVARVAQEFALNAPSEEVTQITANKARFREFQQTHGLDGPRHVWGADLAELARRTEELNPPLMVKPVDRSGSLGICRVGSADAKEMRLALGEAGQSATMTKWS